MFYVILADLIVALHVAYVSFILFGQLAIVLGMVCRWRWVRNFWFRVAHFLAIAFVAFEAIIGMACPLTVWEDDLRRASGQDITEGTFIGRLLHDLLFYQAEPWIFTTAYVSFALLVLLTLVAAPPRWRGFRRFAFLSPPYPPDAAPGSPR
jgi:hypothetical protein